MDDPDCWFLFLFFSDAMFYPPTFPAIVAHLDERSTIMMEKNDYDQLLARLDSTKDSMQTESECSMQKMEIGVLSFALPKAEVRDVAVKGIQDRDGLSMRSQRAQEHYARVHGMMSDANRGEEGLQKYLIADGGHGE